MKRPKTYTSEELRLVGGTLPNPNLVRAWENFGKAMANAIDKAIADSLAEAGEANLMKAFPRTQVETAVKPDTEWQSYRTIPEYVEGKKVAHDEIIVSEFGGNSAKVGQWAIKHTDGTISILNPMQFEREFEKVVEE